MVTGRAFVARRKRNMNVNRYIYFRVDLCVGTPVDELKGHSAGYAEKGTNKLNRYTDEHVRLWTCRAVETLTGRS